MENVLNIRQAEICDLQSLTDIYNSVIKEGGFMADLNSYSVEDRHKWFIQNNTDDYGIYVIVKNNEIVAYFYFSPWRSGRAALKSIAELSFYICKGARGEGLGNCIVSNAISLANKKGFSHLIAILLDINTRSRDLLLKWDFHISGKLPDIAQLHDQRAGQLIMLKTLN